MSLLRVLASVLAGVGWLLPVTALAEGVRLVVPAVPADPVTLSLGERPSGLSLEDMVQVYVGEADRCCDGKSPMAGTYGFADGAVVFDPAFDFLEGQPYTVTSWQGDVTEFAIQPAAQAPVPEVLAIYPSGDTVPENTLRFYIEFSAPMMPHQSAELIALEAADGTVETSAFMHFKQELWNADRTRLTLLMDPGRIKRGVAQNRRLGPALLETERYALVISDGWPAANGRAVASGFAKPFVVAPALRSLPSVEAWELSVPEIESVDPVTVVFDRPFDRFQTLESLTLRRPDGTRVGGTSRLEENETVWRFTPVQPWDGTPLELVVDARLEDVAGNNFRDTLDHAVGTSVREIDHIVIPLPFNARRD